MIRPARLACGRCATVDSTVAVTSNAIAEALFSGENVASEVTSQHLTVNFLGTGNEGNFPDNELFPNMTAEGEDRNDFSILVTGSFSVDSPGTYTIGFNSDDGGLLQVNGEDVIVFDNTRGAANSLSDIELVAGEHDLRFIMWERGGGSGAELFISNEPVSLSEFDETQFRLLTATPVSQDGGLGGEAPPLTSVSRTVNGIAIGIPEGETYRIEFSADLETWTAVAEGQTVLYEDTDAERTRAVTGYYRGVRP